jgi:tRNA(adenine34) deaminase
MEIAIEEARTARDRDEVPVGAVIVRDGEVLARDHNRSRELSCATRHAEMLIIEEASLVTGNERLTGCVLFVTKEPCAMCAGAIVHARIERVIIAARDSKYGACGTVLDVCGNPALNHQPVVEFGLMERESVDLLQSFFRARRGAGRQSQ